MDVWYIVHQPPSPRERDIGFTSQGETKMSKPRPQPCPSVAHLTPLIDIGNVSVDALMLMVYVCFLLQ